MRLLICLADGSVHRDLVWPKRVKLGQELTIRIADEAGDPLDLPYLVVAIDEEDVAMLWPVETVDA